jgi:regulator of nucleoside diphosphate kinase
LACALAAMEHFDMTTISLSDFNLSPGIVLGLSDHRQLIVLALAGRGHTADDADGLLYELERAEVVADDALPTDAVRMGSSVRYRTNGGAERVVTLVVPKDADIGEGRISVLTPVGTALLGLRPGQSITWLTRDGRNQVLTVLTVTQSAGDEDDPGPLAA